MRWEERRTGQTKFFWHEAFRNSGFDKMPWEVNFGGLEAEADTNRKTQIRVSAFVLANTYRRETTFTSCRKWNAPMRGETIIVSHPNPFFFRENMLSHPFILLFLSFFGRANHNGSPAFLLWLFNSPLQFDRRNVVRGL